MGYGLPAAIAMKTLYPERTVVCVAGDGDFLMTGQEFATAVQYELPIIVVVSDNGIYGTIRMHQEREYPGRVIATQLTQPGFRRLCARLRRLRRDGREDRRFSPPPSRPAQASGKPSIIHLKIDPEAITPGDHAQRDPRQGAEKQARLTGRIAYTPRRSPGEAAMALSVDILNQINAHGNEVLRHNLQFLYEALSILDRKANALLAFDGLLVAAAAFGIEKGGIVRRTLGAGTG